MAWLYVYTIYIYIHIYCIFLANAINIPLRQCKYFNGPKHRHTHTHSSISMHIIWRLSLRSRRVSLHPQLIYISIAGWCWWWWCVCVFRAFEPFQLATVCVFIEHYTLQLQWRYPNGFTLNSEHLNRSTQLNIASSSLLHTQTHGRG